MAYDSKSELPPLERALPGRADPMPVPGLHVLRRSPLAPPFPVGHHRIIFGMGCFWGAEQCFWSVDGVYSTHCGYAGGYTPNPTYQEVCSGLTAHAEVVRVVFDPGKVELMKLLRIFWQSHDPTQGMRQGTDNGTQYRSIILAPDEPSCAAAIASRDAYQQALVDAGYGDITTEIRRDQGFYYAEEYHQQYLAKNPSGHCGLAATGVTLDS